MKLKLRTNLLSEAQLEQIITSQVMTLRELRRTIMREEIEVRSFDRQNCVDDQGALSDKVIEEIYSFKLTEEDLRQVELENAKSDQNKDQDKEEKFDEESGLLNFIDDIFQTPDE